MMLAATTRSAIQTDCASLFSLITIQLEQYPRRMTPGLTSNLQEDQHDTHSSLTLMVWSERDIFLFDLELTLSKYWLALRSCRVLEYLQDKLDKVSHRNVYRLKAARGTNLFQLAKQLMFVVFIEYLGYPMYSE
mmetsp:Transcript_31005/g.50161  ORF Transcript_31005/g.50161 Transcript_31005/m.50161 type:complete len:134 (-) Transcript_31005:96-497(-)